MSNTDTTTKSAKSTTATAYDWREDMRKAGELKSRGETNIKAASTRLWKATKAGITEWLPTSETDVQGEGLYAEFLRLYGETRKGDCSKMTSVAVAVKDHGLVLSAYPNLSQAYAEARRLTKTVKQEKAEDTAADAAVEAIEAPGTARTPESAAKILLSKGVDGAIVAVLDVLAEAAKAAGAKPEDAYRSFLRGVSTEVAARVQAAKPKPVKKATTAKDGATKAKSGGQGTKAKPAAAATKAKPAATKATPVKAKPATAKAKAASEALAAKAEDAGVEPVSNDADDMFAEIEDEAPAPAATKAAPVKAKPVKAKPVVKASRA